MLLNEKVAIVTGSGRGIGRAIALAFAQVGADIVVADWQADLAVVVADEVRQLGRRAMAVTTDVTRSESVIAMVESALQEFGKVDIFVSNAGIQRRYFVQDLPPQELQAMLDVNLFGFCHGCQALLPTFYAQNGGNIILIDSDSGKHGYAYNSAYCASKFAALGFMEALADEAKPHGVRVNAICPAGVQTEMTASVRRSDGSPFDSSGFMDPDEIADVAVFLASPQSRGIHGQAINVYGGVNYRVPASK